MTDLGWFRLCGIGRFHKNRLLLIAGEFVDPRLGSAEIGNEASNDSINLMGIVAVTFHAPKCMGLSGSSTDHFSAFPDRHPCSPYDPD